MSPVTNPPRRPQISSHSTDSLYKSGIGTPRASAGAIGAMRRAIRAGRFGQETRMRGMFVNDAWYVAAWSDELTDRPLARTLLGHEIVLRRRSDGTAAALEEPRQASLRSYPTVEQHGCILWWTGRPAHADRTPIRD